MSKSQEIKKQILELTKEYYKAEHYEKMNKPFETNGVYDICVQQVERFMKRIVVVKPQIISGDFRRLFKTEIPVTVCGQ